MHTIQPTWRHQRLLRITPLENLLKSPLIPPDCRVQPRKLPHPINLPIIMLIGCMAMPHQLHLLPASICIHLMRSSQLMVPDNFCLRDTFPARCTEQVLRFDAGVAQKTIRGYHVHEILARHGRPRSFADLRVINAESGRENTAEAVPVLRVSVNGLLEGKGPERKVLLHHNYLPN